MTSKKGSTSAPFQLLISIIVFGMALTIGWFLIDNMQCWKCNEMLKIEASDLKETIVTVGRGDTNSRRIVRVEVEDLGSCAQGIYLRQVDSTSGTLSCKTFCPQHPNSCWVIMTKSRCGNQDFDIECVDISGETLITTDPDILGTISDSSNMWIDQATAFSHTLTVSITKTGPNELHIGKG